MPCCEVYLQHIEVTFEVTFCVAAWLALKTDLNHLHVVALMWHLCNLNPYYSVWPRLTFHFCLGETRQGKVSLKTLSPKNQPWKDVILLPPTRIIPPLGACTATAPLIPWGRLGPEFQVCQSEVKTSTDGSRPVWLMPPMATATAKLEYKLLIIQAFARQTPNAFKRTLSIH